MPKRIDFNALKQAELAEMLFSPRTGGPVDVRTIQRWHADGLPRHGEGRGCTYVWAEVLPWYIRLVSGSSGDVDLDDKARKLKAEADLAEMEARKMAGELLEAAEVQGVWSDQCARMRAKLLCLPAVAALRLEDGMTVANRETVLRDAVHEALAELVAEEDPDA